MNQLTSEQIIQEIEKAFEAGRKRDQENVYTLKELKKLLQMSDNAVYQRLDILEDEGRLECTNKMVKTRATGISGKRIWRHVTAYKIRPSEEDGNNPAG
jgi:DNA-binding transcriptional MocR family regulator